MHAAAGPWGSNRSRLVEHPDGAVADRNHEGISAGGEGEGKMENGEWKMGSGGRLEIRDSRLEGDARPRPARIRSPSGGAPPRESEHGPNGPRAALKQVGAPAKPMRGLEGENRKWRMENRGDRRRALHESAPPPGELRRSRWGGHFATRKRAWPERATRSDQTGRSSGEAGEGAASSPAALEQVCVADPVTVRTPGLLLTSLLLS